MNCIVGVLHIKCFVTLAKELCLCFRMRIPEGVGAQTFCCAPTPGLPAHPLVAPRRIGARAVDNFFASVAQKAKASQEHGSLNLFHEERPPWPSWRSCTAITVTHPFAAHSVMTKWKGGRQAAAKKLLKWISCFCGLRRDEEDPPRLCDCPAASNARAADAFPARSLS